MHSCIFLSSAGADACDWADFRVWSPVGQMHVERIQRDDNFISIAVQRMKQFYFSKFLPCAVQSVLV